LFSFFIYFSLTRRRNIAPIYVADRPEIATGDIER